MDSFSAVRQLAQQLQELVVIHWLDEVTVKAGFLRAPAIVFLPPACQRDNDDVFAPRLLADVAADLVAVKPRQADVQQDNVRALLLDHLDRFDSIMRHERLIAGDLQQHREWISRVSVVVDNDDTPCY